MGKNYSERIIRILADCTWEFTVPRRLYWLFLFSLVAITGISVIRIELVEFENPSGYCRSLGIIVK